jgi:lipopolysaccharide biosynthesis protein
MTTRLPPDETPLPAPGNTPVAKLLVKELSRRVNQPWRTVWLHYETALLRTASRWSFLSERRRAKMKRQVAKREPERYLEVIAEAEKISNELPRLTTDRAVEYLPYDPSLKPPETDVTAIAFYLPQFHPFEENNRWWGNGFTEWTNVGKARPLFKGHYQPHCPIHFGYYDLRVPEVMVEQAKVARQYGVGGFAYHFYWFAGRTIMDLPLRGMLGNAAVEMPFFLSWANENWTRRWDGRDNEVLIAQDYSLEDGRAMMRHVSEYMRDPRYIRVDGRPVFSVYRPGRIPELEKMVEVWREEARNQGVGDLHLLAVQTKESDDHRNAGFDANLEFSPHGGLTDRDLSLLYGQKKDSFEGSVHSYETMVRLSLEQKDDAQSRYRCVTLGWDNTARVPTRAAIFDGFTIDSYRRWLSELCERARTETWRKPDERFVFINAWNEWAEGTHLEPDQRFGFAYLEATRQAVQGQTDR